MRVLSKCLIAAASAGAAMVLPASAAPITAPSGLQQAVAATAQVQTVQWRGRWIGPAIVGGVIAGAAIAASRPWGYGYYGYGYGPGYYGYGYPRSYYYDDYAYDPGYAVVPAPSYGYRSYGGGDVSYCEQRFRSYNRATGTYTGYDGQQHPCP